MAKITIEVPDEHLDDLHEFLRSQVSDWDRASVYDFDNVREDLLTILRAINEAQP